MKLARLICVIPCALAVFGCASMLPASYRVDAHVPSTSATVVWGYLPAGRAPVLTIRSGQTVRIDTVSHQGLLSGTDPDRKSTRLNSSHGYISYAVFCLKKKKKKIYTLACY